MEEKQSKYVKENSLDEFLVHQTVYFMGVIQSLVSQLVSGFELRVKS